MLVYGRRDEYDGNQWRTGIRASYKTDDIDIMSYDRLKPISDYRQFVSCKLSHGMVAVYPNGKSATFFIFSKGIFERLSKEKRLELYAVLSVSQNRIHFLLYRFSGR